MYLDESDSGKRNNEQLLEESGENTSQDRGSMLEREVSNWDWDDFSPMHCFVESESLNIGESNVSS